MESLSEFREITADKSRNLILIGNKMDKLKTLPKGFKDFVEHETIFVSGKRKENINQVADHLQKVVEHANLSDKTIISNSRHYEALHKALGSITNVRAGLRIGISPDLLTTDIRKALYHLGEITGEVTTDEILGAIFSRFCIGK